MTASQMFGRRLVELRKQHDLTQDDLANLLGITRAALSHYETERREPNIDMLLRISDRLDVSVDSLLKGEQAH